MTDTTALRELLAKVMAGQYSDQTWLVWHDLYAPREWKIPSERAQNAFCGNLSAAAGLAENLIPGWHWGMDDVGANVYLGAAHRPKAIFSAKGEPARALLICIIEAMIWDAGQ